MRNVTVDVSYAPDAARKMKTRSNVKKSDRSKPSSKISIRKRYIVEKGYFQNGIQEDTAV